MAGDVLLGRRINEPLISMLRGEIKSWHGEAGNVGGVTSEVSLHRLYMARMAEPIAALSIKHESVISICRLLCVK